MTPAHGARTVPCSAPGLEDARTGPPGGPASTGRAEKFAVTRRSPATSGRFLLAYPVSLLVGKAACYPLAAAQTGGVRRFTGLVGRVVVYRWFSRVTRSAISDHGNAGNAAGQDGAVVTVYENGPLIVRGRFAVTAQDGQPIPAGRGTVALCRCGRSAIKPFCDGTHARTGFRAPGGAQEVRAAQDGNGRRGPRQPAAGVNDAAPQPAG